MVGTEVTKYPRSLALTRYSSEFSALYNERPIIVLILILILIPILILIIYMKKFLDCDWLKEMQFFGNTVQKKGNLVQ